MSRFLEFLRGAAALDEPVPPRSTPPAAVETAIDSARVWAALATVIDPEIGLDIVTLGMVYEVEVIENAVRVTFTLTTPGCPLAEVITQGVEHAVAGVPGVAQVLPLLVWDPPWNPGMIREGAL